MSFRFLLLLVLICCSPALLGQSVPTGESVPNGESSPIGESVIQEEEDSFYREDQFYLGVTYNLLTKRPEGVSQSNLSYGLNLGFIRDMPLNKKSTVAIGLGIGYGLNSYYSNLRAIEGDQGPEYFVVDRASYRRNKVETHLIEVPLEFRWRTSTPDEYKFWRIYAGMKFGYIVGSRSKYVSDDLRESFQNRDTENFRYGLMINVGYNTFNLHAYYGLNALFEEGVADQEGRTLEMVPLRLGLTFYIL